MDGRVGESDSSATDFFSQVGCDHLSDLIVVINAVSDDYLHSVIGPAFADGRNLDMDVIAEGIESTAQEDILRDLGCVFGPGYLFARPLEVAAATALLAGTQWVAAGTVLPPSGSRSGAPPS